MCMWFINSYPEFPPWFWLYLSGLCKSASNSSDRLMQPLFPCAHPHPIIFVWSSKKSSNLTSTCLLLYLSLSVLLWIVCSLPLREKCLCSKASLFLQCRPSCCFQLLSDMALKWSSFPPRIFISSFLSPFEFEFFSCA